MGRGSERRRGVSGNHVTHLSLPNPPSPRRAAREGILAMYLLLALLSAIFAALVAIFGKIGLSGVDSTLATTVRSVIMAVLLVLASAAGGKLGGLTGIGGRAWWAILGAGIAGAVSWLAYFLALKHGPATHVAAIDRLSVVVVIVLAALFLGEALTWKIALGGALMVVGAIFIVW